MKKRSKAQWWRCRASKAQQCRSVLPCVSVQCLAALQFSSWSSVVFCLVQWRHRVGLQKCRIRFALAAAVWVVCGNTLFSTARAGACVLCSVRGFYLPKRQSLLCLGGLQYPCDSVSLIQQVINVTDEEESRVFDWWLYSR